MNHLTGPLRELRSKLPLKPRSECIRLLQSRLDFFKGIDNPNEEEKFAVFVAGKAIQGLLRVKNDNDGIDFINSWVRWSLSETVGFRRSVVFQIGSALLTVDFVEKK